MMDIVSFRFTPYTIELHVFPLHTVVIWEGRHSVSFCRLLVLDWLVICRYFG